MRQWFAISLSIAVMLVAMPAGASSIPTSARSREAIERIRPSLEKKLQEKGFYWGAPIFIRIFKAEKCLEVWLHNGRGFRLFKRFEICTYGWQGLGPKTTAGDGVAPEGFYYVTPRQLNPYSRYHLAFNLGYPNLYDCRKGRTGSALMVHGACVSVGCFAMTNARMEMIYALADAALREGQPFFRVHIFPFPMTEKMMASHCRSANSESSQERCRWLVFWRNLKEGYDYFERHHQPPNVQLRHGRYVFKADD